MYLRKRFYLGILALGLIFLFGCSGAGDIETPTDEPSDLIAVESIESEDVVDANIETEEVEAATPSPSPEPTATPAPTATPISAEISLPTAADESIYLETSELVFDQISSPEDGWLVIWPDSNSALSADKALGFVEVEAGLNDEVVVPVEVSQISGRAVQVALHGGRSESGGELGAETGNLLLIQTLAVDTPTSRPMIDSATSVVMEDGFLRVDKVQSDGPGWLAIFDRATDQMLGFAPVESGASADIPVPVRWQVATSEVQIRLLQDLGNVTEFEAEVDLQAEFQGKSVALDLDVGLPAEIVIFDQPMPDFVVVNRVTTPVDGFLVVFGDENEDGSPETILGSIEVEAGATEYVEININDGAATPQVLLSLFTDSNGTGEFDFPDDEPVRVGLDGPRQLIVPVRSDIEGLLSVDTSPSADTLHVNLVASPVDAWLVVEIVDEDSSDNNEGELALAAQLSLDAGLYHSLDVPIEGVSSGDLVRVKLYANNPDIELFDPERNDFPLQADGRLVFVELTIE